MRYKDDWCQCQHWFWTLVYLIFFLTVFILNSELLWDDRSIGEFWRRIFSSTCTRLIFYLSCPNYSICCVLLSFLKVSSRGRIFFGCWQSTFTGYINRIRGYHSIKDKTLGHENGELPNTFYYVTRSNKSVMHKYSKVDGSGFYSREYPTSWRGIDKGITELAAITKRQNITSKKWTNKVMLTIKYAKGLIAVCWSRTHLKIKHHNQYFEQEHCNLFIKVFVDLYLFDTYFVQ